MKFVLIPLFTCIAAVAFPSSIEAESKYYRCTLFEEGITAPRIYDLDIDSNNNKVVVLYMSRKAVTFSAEQKDKDTIFFGKDGNNNTLDEKFTFNLQKLSLDYKSFYTIDDKNINEAPYQSGKCVIRKKPDYQLEKKRYKAYLLSLHKKKSKYWCDIYKSSEENETCQNYLFEGFKNATSKEKINAYMSVLQCEDEIEDLKGCFKKIEKICSNDLNSKEISICRQNFKSCEFGGSSQWKRDGYISLRDCVEGNNYAMNLCQKVYKKRPYKSKAWNNYVTCIIETEDKWKAKGTTNNFNKSPIANPYSDESRCINAADFQGCMNYYSGNTYSPTPSNNRSNSNGFQIWQDSINSQKELRRKFKMDNLEYRIDKMETDALRNRLFP